MAEIKTRQNEQSVEAFLNRVEDEKKRTDCFTIVELMKKATNAEPKMWGDAIVGFGQCHYKYASGREGDMPIIAFSPRKQNLTLYIEADFAGHDELMSKLGKYKTGKVCLYIKKLADVDMTILNALIQQSVEHTVKTNS